ncbi:hypothetical protein [Arthrobacter sp.]|uniref:hypothetical protein n=1 Tax=Arthrobacter sp. TaxID=1667 RepID=UPI003A913941
MSSLTVCRVRRDAATLRVATILFRLAVAFGLWVLLAVIVFAVNPWGGVFLFMAGFPYSIIMTALSVTLAAAGRTGATTWLVCVGTAWLLTAPLANWYEFALARLDPTTGGPVVAEFYWHYWPWAIPAALAHVAIGIYCSRRASRTAA